MAAGLIHLELKEGATNSLYYYLNDAAWYKSTPITDTDWHHVVAVYDPDSNTNSKLYLDGAEVNPGSGTAVTSFPTSLPFAGLKTIIGSYEEDDNGFMAIDMNE